MLIGIQTISSYTVWNLVFWVIPDGFILHLELIERDLILNPFIAHGFVHQKCTLMAYYLTVILGLEQGDYNIERMDLQSSLKDN